MRKFSSLLTISTVLALVNVARAQYPVIPPEMEKKADAIMENITALSEQQFLKVKPVVDAEAKNGKPYIPWAAKPSDLPQAKLAAFPGAEGGGAFSLVAEVVKSSW